MTTERNAQGVGIMAVLHLAIYDLQSRRDGDDYTHIDECARLTAEENEALAAVAELVEAARAIKPAECPCKDCARLAAALAKFTEPRP